MSGFKSIARRASALTLLSLTVLATQIMPAAAHPLGSDGMVRAFVDCNMYSHVATVKVSTMIPSGSKTTGFYFYTQVWAKARYETVFNPIKTVESPLIKTWSKTSSGVWINNPKTILGTTFTGNVRAYYDVAIQYWFRTPTGAWQGPRTFYVPGDAQSTIQQTAWDGLTWTSVPAGDCWL